MSQVDKTRDNWHRAGVLHLLCGDEQTGVVHALCTKCRMILAATAIVVPMVMCAIIGCSREKVEFEFKDYAITDHLGTPQVQVIFRAAGSVTFVLRDPSGSVMDSKTFHKDASEAILRMADHMTTPKKGRYTLDVRDSKGGQISSETFDFAGPDVTISEVTFGWNFYGTLYYGYHHSLDRFSFKIRNTGDLPAYAYGAYLQSGTSSFDVVLEVALPPGAERTVSKYSLDFRIEPVPQQTCTLFVRDAAGNTVTMHSESIPCHVSAL